MKTRLILENNKGEAVRVFNMTADEGHVIYRQDTRRVEVHMTTEKIDDAKVPYTKLGQISKKQQQENPFPIGALGHLRFIDTVSETTQDVPMKNQNSKLWLSLLALLFVSTMSFVGYLVNMPIPERNGIEELKEEVIQIIQRAKIVQPKTVVTPVENVQTKTVTPKANVRRMGALAVLGSLNKGAQKGGLNLGAVQTTAGPGLGGTGGSGGMQTSLYAKGIVGSPVGPGANAQGAGGYGTKGKGGGQAGYGSLSLVGSAGTNPIPLGNEATIDGGLDRDLIAAVVAKNMGQIKFCYEQGLQMDPKLKGRVVVNFTIDGSGIVSSTGINNTTLQSKTVEDCIMIRLRSWKFPLPKGGVSVKVSYPFMLQRAGA